MARKKKKTGEKRFEFSKLIITVLGLVNIAIVVFTCILMWRTGDTSPLSYLIPSLSAEMATATGFYYSKAKVENRIKLMSAYDVDITEQSFSEII